MSRRLLVLALPLATALSVPRAASAVALLRGMGGPAGFGEPAMAPNDDASSQEIPLVSGFPYGLRFFGQVFRALYVNNNGNVTFGGPLATFTPQAFPVAQQRMIAPYWADVDTRGAAAPGENRVYWHLASHRAVVTWYRVGYYSSAVDRRNDFQLVLIDRPDRALGDFDVEFRYASCEWTTGNASGGSGGLGGTPAQAGFDAGDQVHYATVPGSQTPRIRDVCATSNVNEPGRWLFEIRNGRVAICGNEHVEELDEDCDDGNTRDNDGCSSRCRLEPDAGAYVLRQAARAVAHRREAGVDLPAMDAVAMGDGSVGDAGGTLRVAPRSASATASAPAGPTRRRSRACACGAMPGSAAMSPWSCVAALACCAAAGARTYRRRGRSK